MERGGCGLISGSKGLASVTPGSQPLVAGVLEEDMGQALSSVREGPGSRAPLFPELKTGEPVGFGRRVVPE